MIAFFKSIWDLFFGSNNDNELSNNPKEEYKNKIEDNYETLSQEKIDDWKSPSKDLKVEQVFLSDKKPSILYIPGGFVNGFMSLTDDMKLMFFSPATLEESLKDDFRFSFDYWDNWIIKPR